MPGSAKLRACSLVIAASFQPDDGDKNEDCVTFTLGDGRWTDLECGTPLPYACE